MEFNKDDLEITPFKGSGDGGQHRNKTLSCIRVKYKPLNIVVEATRHRKQGMNKKEALKLLAEKIGEFYDQADRNKRSQRRQERLQDSKPIRTYNVKDNRCTDHRLRKNFALDRTLAGDLDTMLSELKGNYHE